MDIGVGTFIVSTAITSRFVRRDPTRETASQKKWSVQLLMVLILGFGRFAVLKAVDYHEHVSEYGIHWNFFATLFCVWASADVVHAYVPRQHIPWLALTLLVAYQTALSTTGLTDYVFSDYRADIISANKEGILSLCGYVPLYLLTEAVSQRLFFRTHASNANSPAKTSLKQQSEQTEMASKRKTRAATAQSHASAENTSGQEHESDALNSPEKTRGSPTSGVKKLDTQLVKSSLVYAAVLWVLWYVSSTAVQNTSRRLMNFAYVCMVLALTLTTILSLHVADSLSSSCVNCSSDVGVATLHYMSKHSLVVFLVANVLTGAVNMSMHTIHASPELSFAVLVGYTFVVTSAAWLVEYASNWHSKLNSRQGKS